ncbi:MULTISPECIES: aldehyde dehydrogenase family protein [Rhodobacterales]|jgi:acyl-CoA reductase-like NAD-dependent aldehyde dehydrogenase|uniref:aldehyde dehydrogenase family protein n=1 Tax=Rhodobacterales TaxID=204455 RepID=UPI00237FA2C2|nr:aldehyde dehydrogenase family protein [Phaeobacter gallaeciensis]MDE4142795.1 aldehyde dehydrogenase family protein [Phaeobacter gallaeciensis]MDE4151235.1 aldehyde dehydrogenase family protein [Phaeobacter gallaeciensis]MDE4155471.1 aldehyde dehydrogenase family protein [Phaeobacter gallaeciensis]MDE4230862.1 aldehyde dehydrogenase family protein [Phaeobacter gallaeciensis]MDE4259937.1 aldehyde dehydrogenase family protein [Phaeobacter gallaeciensis]
MSQTLKCISPIDGSVFAERETLSREDAFAAAERARAAQAAWAARPLQERIDLVMAGVAKVGEMNDVIVPELAHMMGRPVRFGGEFGGFNERASHMAEIAKEALADIEVGEDETFKRYIKRIPQGVVFVVAPWNYPYMTAINTVAPALIAGNTVVLKHATQTLLVGERMAEAFHAAGVPADVFQNVFLDHDTTSELIAAKAFDFVNFTGSVGGGQAMERAAAGTFTGVGTELGGKDPGYVMEDADIDAAVDTLIDGAMFNSGQCCCGIERIYVHESVYDAFLAKALEIVKGYKLGNPMDPETSIGPMANVRFAKEVREQIAEALEMGAVAQIETFAEDDGGAYLTPQILTNVTHDMRVMRDESFGPVVGIMKVSSDEEAIKLMNDSEFGLTASLWTSDVDRAQRIGDQIETGTVFMNRADYLDPGLCWTGCKNTGRGGGLSVIGYHNLTRPKSYHLKKVTG